MNYAALSPLTVPQKIAFAGDWHANRYWAVQAIRHAADQHADVIVHLGDFGYMFHPSYLSELELELDRFDIPLLFVDGNHEDHKWLAQQKLDAEGLRPLGRHIYHLPRGFRWSWDGVRFLALGGAHSVDGIWRRRSGDLWCKEERIIEAEAEYAAAGGQADIMITHDCPAGVNIPGLPPPGTFPEIEIMRAEEHRWVLRRVVDAVQPQMLWHGHYHSAYATIAHFGYGPVNVVGLDMDATTMGQNIDVVALATLKSITEKRGKAHV